MFRLLVITKILDKVVDMDTAIAKNPTLRKLFFNLILTLLNIKIKLKCIFDKSSGQKCTFYCHNLHLMIYTVCRN